MPSVLSKTRSPWGELAPLHRMACPVDPPLERDSLVDFDAMRSSSRVISYVEGRRGREVLGIVSRRSATFLEGPTGHENPTPNGLEEERPLRYEPPPPDRNRIDEDGPHYAVGN